MPPSFTDVRLFDETCFSTDRAGLLCGLASLSCMAADMPIRSHWLSFRNSTARRSIPVPVRFITAGRKR
ncbi:Uncharacterised protein [Enterobacter cloacae]|uniref:Uncharacterized protein n=1 Tax=Enterobacter cloacae TaxID=550 RepID=A0A377M1Q2_ENTCL|nr:Uncharacterised protein [Enterobacter cloacae]